MDIQWRGMVRWYGIFNRSVEAKTRLLSLYIAGEERAEISPLLPLAKRLPNSELKRLVKQHLIDEGRHSKLLRSRIRELGGEVFPIPAALEPQEFFFHKGANLDEWLNISKEGPLTRKQIIKVLLFNSVLESAGCTNFLAHAEAVREVDPRTYYLLMRLIPDEIRHASYTLEYAFRLAGTDLRDFALKTKKDLLASQSRYWSTVMGLILTHLIPPEITGMGRVEYRIWQNIAKVQEVRGIKSIWRYAQPVPELIATMPAPYGYGGEEDITRLLEQLQEDKKAA